MLVTWYLSMLHGEDPLEPVYFKDFWEIFLGIFVCKHGAQGTLPQRGLFSPGTQVFSHYPSDYFPGGWNESIPLQLLGFKKVGPEGPQTLVVPGVRLFLDFMSPKQQF